MTTLVSLLQISLHAQSLLLDNLVANDIGEDVAQHMEERQGKEDEFYDTDMVGFNCSTRASSSRPALVALRSSAAWHIEQLVRLDDLVTQVIIRGVASSPLLYLLPGADIMVPILMIASSLYTVN